MQVETEPEEPELDSGHGAWNFLESSEHSKAVNCHKTEFAFLENQKCIIRKASSVLRSDSASQEIVRIFRTPKSCLEKRVKLLLCKFCV